MGVYYKSFIGAMAMISDIEIEYGYWDMPKAWKRIAMYVQESAWEPDWWYDWNGIGGKP